MDLERTLAKLVSFPTVSLDQEENKKALDWIAENVKGLPLHVKRFRSEGFHSLLLTTRRTRKPKLLLAAHLDVVPAAPEGFKARRAGDRLYGRGVCDMKFSIACYLKILHELKDLRKHDLGVLITTDEEVGGLNGTEHVLRQGYSADFAFLPDAGFDWKIDREAKGALVLQAISRGHSAHSAKPWEGQSAIFDLVDFLADLKALFPKEPCGTAAHRHNTVNFGMIEGGQAVNQIPNLAKAWIDIRFLPRTNRAALKKKISRVQKKYPRVKLKDIFHFLPTHLDLDRPEVKLFRKIATEKHGIKTPAFLAHGSSDARFLEARGIDTLVIRPKGGLNHTSREWISLKDLGRFHGVLKEWIRALA